MKNNIKEIRLALNLSQKELAQLCDVSRQTINMVENDKYDPSLPLAMKLARSLNRSIEQLFELDD
ncbi:helix-turn-helix transcriptional regulator [Facklamia sp. DSM 111018]|uniref:Helix-turn-helix transcriptional regulator n=1 Tax=Facklamia lactis TaxID=2749967 RepID=A0ABS0LR89_9LACT|nr:helix-turn-helix transcriptional regulator [Facklamia lactis]MBG9979527.1 helix-turn-helix transcriptional regulator [Facklamia lactis]MBG9985804.1 helix-turn-helix transcriptional regulator [Facklamia lactis]